MPGIIFNPFRKKDLEEPSLSMLNEFWRKLAEQINELWGLTGPVLLHDDLDLQGHSILNATLAGATASSSSTAPSLYGPHSNRPNAAGTAEGTLYLETDRTVLYQLQLVSSVKRWVYIAGIMQGLFAGRPLAPSLGMGDSGMLYHAGDNGQVYKFTYPAWSVLNLRGGTIEGTHTGRLAGGRYDAKNLAPGTRFLETDRTVTYIVQVVTGTSTWIYESGTMRDVVVNRPLAAGLGTVDTGLRFFATDQTQEWRWSGTAWVLEPELSTPMRDTFANRPLAASLGANDVGFRFFATDYTHEWWWDGTAWIVQPENSTPMRGTIYGPDQKPTLAANDAGFLFYSTDFLHLYRWMGAAWEPGPGDDRRGWVRGWGTIDPPTTGWHLLDGSLNVRISRDDGSTAVIGALDNVTGHYLKLAGAYAGVGAAVAPGLSGDTADENTHMHGVTGNTGSSTTGLSVNSAVTGISVDAHTTAADTTVTGAVTRVTTATHNVVDAGHAHGVTDVGHLHSVAITSAAGTNHKHAKGTLAVDATGQPASFTMAAYLRL